METNLYTLRYWLFSKSIQICIHTLYHGYTRSSSSSTVFSVLAPSKNLCEAASICLNIIHFLEAKSTYISLWQGWLSYPFYECSISFNSIKSKFEIILVDINLAALNVLSVWIVDIDNSVKNISGGLVQEQSWFLFALQVKIVVQVSLLW